MSAKKVLGSVLIAVLGGLTAVLLYSLIENKEPAVIVQELPAARYINLPAAESAAPTDFVMAAEEAVHAVVHVKTKALSTGSGNPLYDWFFGYGSTTPTPVVGYGSGVIITSNGYIVTNNHVIEGSQEIEVTLNDKKAYDAELIGRDPSTDLAVLKIKRDNLPFLRYGNSDALRLGEWVLAIGNPYNLTSTVTAGIISAKARNINIQADQMAIESFIQTDAAVNPGNSGGALVNTRGELVGINAAIASPRTGTFTGYSFAIPVSIVEKVVTDIIEFGTVQRAILGVTIADITDEVAKEYKIETMQGVLVTALRDDGAASAAGMKQNDIITTINGVKVNSPSELQEQVSRYRPNDRISVTALRNDKEIQFDVVLRNLEGGTGIVKKEQAITTLGASFEEVPKSEMKKLGISYGVRVADVGTGKFRSAGIRNGFIITQINNKPVSSPEDIRSILEKAEGGIYVEGIYPDGLIAYYAIRL
jgi:Do/DeqQ family serine protease